MTDLIQTALLDLGQRLAAIYGTRLHRLVLFGSHARGDASCPSDVDVVVALEGTVDPCAEIARTEQAVGDVSLEHDTVIACVFVPRAELETGQSPLLANVRREGVVLQ